MPRERDPEQVALDRRPVELVPEHDREVGIVAAHRPLGLRRLQLLETYVQARRPDEQLREDRGKQDGRGGREGGHPDEPGKSSREGVDLLLRGRELTGDRLRVHEQQPPGGRQ